MKFSFLCSETMAEGKLDIAQVSEMFPPDQGFDVLRGAGKTFVVNAGGDSVEIFVKQGTARGFFAHPDRYQDFTDASTRFLAVRGFQLFCVDPLESDPWIFSAATKFGEGGTRH